MFGPQNKKGGLNLPELHRQRTPEGSHLPHIPHFGIICGTALAEHRVTVPVLPEAQANRLDAIATRLWQTFWFTLGPTVGFAAGTAFRTSSREDSSKQDEGPP